MNPVLYKFRLDVAKMGSQACIYVKKGDVQSRQLQIYLHNGTAPYIVADGTAVVLRAVKPDDTVIFNDCTADGNVVSHLLTLQEAAVAGVLKCELNIYGADNEVLFAPEFDVVVTEPQAEDSIIESSSEFSALAAALSDALEYRNKWSNPYAEAVDGDEAEANIVLEESAVRFGFTLPRGKTPAISVGSVTSLPNGNNPVVELDPGGTKDAPVFNFGIPAGKPGGKGDKGDPGTSFTLLGLYATLSELLAAHPTGEEGDAYAVGTSEDNTVYIWDVDASGWVDVGPLQGPPGEPGRQGNPTMVNGKTGESITLTYEDVGAAPTVHNHVISDVTGLQSALDAKAQASDVSASVATLNTAIAAKYAKPLRFHDVSVAGSLWAGDGTHADYAYKCDIPLTGVTADMTPDVVLPLAVAVGGEVAPIAESGAGYVRLYASAAQSDMVIPTITCWKEV